VQPETHLLTVQVVHQLAVVMMQQTSPLVLGIIYARWQILLLGVELIQMDLKYLMILVVQL
jgi:hypothetical protein